MSTREEDRKNRRVEDGCLSPSTLPVCETVPNSRRVADPCGDIVLPNPCDFDLSKFLSPENIPAELSDSPALPYIELDSAATTVTCADKPGTTGTVLGDSVTAPVIAARVYLSGISDLTQLQRRHLATVSQPNINNWPALTTSEVMEEGQLTSAQATQLLSAANAAQSGIDDAAFSAALSALNCFYENVEKLATCETDINGVAAETYGSNPVTVNAGLFQSSISQADADALALASATAQLNCVWFNTTQAAETCAVDGLGNAVPNSFAFNGSNSPTPETQVGSVTVNAGVVRSAASRADANLQALDIARGFLNCFFLNAEQIATCNTDADLIAADESLGTTSSTVASGAVSSTVGVADANETALAIAESRLLCRWGSEETTTTCDSPENPTYELGKDAIDGYHNASETVSVKFSATSDDAQFVSEISKADANQQALTFLRAQLDCAWCSDAIGALCTTGDSLDETDGAAANAYCASSYLMAQDLAVVAAAIPIKVKVEGTPTCRYANEEIRATCYPKDGSSDSKYDAEEATTKGLLSPTSDAQFVIVAEGAMVSVTSVGDATATARSIALSQLDCFWENTAQACPSGSIGLDVLALTTRSYTSKADADATARGLLFCEVVNAAASPATCADDVDDQPVSANATSSFTTPAGLFRASVGEAETTGDVAIKQTAVNVLAASFAAQQLDCFWENTTQACPSGSIGLDVLALTTRSYTSKADADATARGLLFCEVVNASGDPVTCPLDGDAVAVSANATSSFTTPAGLFRASVGEAETTGDVAIKQTAVNVLAVSFAAQQLDCFWENTTQSCPESLGVTVYGEPIPALTVRSYTSQAEADATARGLLFCEVVNAAASPATCADDVDDQPVSSNAASSFATPAGLFRDSVSEAATSGEVATKQTALNVLAVSFAAQQLDCFWENTTQSCPAGALGLDVLALTVRSYLNQADADLTARGLLFCEVVNSTTTKTCEPDADGKTVSDNATASFTADYGIFRVSVGQDESPTAVVVKQTAADAQAETFADLQLDCFWESAAVELRCTELDLTAEFDSQATKSPNGAGQVISIGNGAPSGASVSENSTGHAENPVLFPAFSFRSYVRQTEANALAFTAARTQLDCFWESAEIELKCTDLSLETEFSAQATKSPDASETITLGTGSVSGASVSENSTGHADSPVKITARSFRAYTSQTEANAFSFTAARTQLDCFWENAEIELKCTELDLDSEFSTQATKSPEEAEIITIGTGMVSGSSVSENSTGHADSPVKITARSFRAYASQTEANSFALTAARTQLDCFWENAALTLKCYPAGGIDDDFSTQSSKSPDTPDTITIGDGMFDGVAYVDVRATGSTTKPVSVPARGFRSFSNQIEANTFALTTARSQLSCYYYNTEPYAGVCDSGLIPLQEVPPTVAAGTVRNEESLLGANNAAETLAFALIICADPDDVGGGGESGSQGPAGACSSQCGAYYA